MAPIWSKHAPTSCSGERVPKTFAAILSIIVWTPGLFSSPICWVAKFTRSTTAPVSSQSVPSCQPSTLGGLLRNWPM